MDRVGLVDWVWWLAAGVVLTILELLSMDLILLMLAVGCLAAMIVAIPSNSWVASAVVGIVVAAAMLGFVRPGLLRRLHHGPDLKLGARRLIGELGCTDTDISAKQPGQLIIGGEQWTAEPYGAGEVIPAGTTVEVRAIQGTTAYVNPLPPQPKES